MNPRIIVALTLAVTFLLAGSAWLGWQVVLHAVQDPFHTGYVHMAVPGLACLCTFIVGWALPR